MRQAKQCWKFLLRAHDQDISSSNLHVHEHMQLFAVVLRMVPPFATVHTFCASWDSLRKSSFFTVVPAKAEMFLCGL